MNQDPAQHRDDDPYRNPLAPAAAPQDNGDPDEEARQWLANVYQGDRMRQLSVRSVVTGMLIGGVMSISNLYVGLKTGWGLGVTITSCIIAFAVFKFLEAILPAVQRNPFTILENYTMSSAASAAGYTASAGLVSSIPALYLSSRVVLPWWQLMAWIGAVSLLGVFMAIPLKRQLINIEKLPFPTGLATAETLRSMHVAGDEAIQKAKALFASAIVGACVKTWSGLPELLIEVAGKDSKLGQVAGRLGLPDAIPFWPSRISGWANDRLTRNSLGIETSTIMVAAGAIMGIRVGFSLLVGAVVFYGFIGEELINRNITGEGFGGKGVTKWTLWPATAMLVTAGLLSFVFRWKTILRSFRGLRQLVGGGPTEDPLEQIEVPGKWFVLGTGLATVACVELGYWFFDISRWMGLLAVLLTFILSLVAARATGETDITPIGAMGKITQLTYGVLAPTNKITNLMTATITAGASSHSADLLTDLKSGYLLGGNPRHQTISQLFGVVAGVIVCIPVYILIVDPTQLGTEALPVPAAITWASVADLLAEGIGNLPPGALAGMAIGAALGAVLTTLEEFVPKRHHKWIPSPIGLSIAGVIPAYNSISMFLGSAIAWGISKAAPATHEKYTIAASSGLIAGESLLGVGFKVLGVVLPHAK